MSSETDALWEMPGRLLKVQAMELVGDLLRHYEGRSDFLDQLASLYRHNHHLLRVAKRLALAYDSDFHAWYEAQAKHPPIDFAAGSYHNIENWQVLRRLVTRCPERRSHLGRYLDQIENLAARWMRRAPWGPEILHACLLVWQSNPTWRYTRLSVGGGFGAGLPLASINVHVQYDADGHTWEQVWGWVLRDARAQFVAHQQLLDERERRLGRRERLTPAPGRRRKVAESETTRFRNLRWLFLSLAPDPRIGKALTAGAICAHDPSARELPLSTVEKAVSGLRRELNSGISGPRRKGPVAVGASA